MTLVKKADIEQYVKLHSMVLGCFIQKPPLQINERVYSPNIPAQYDPLFVASVNPADNTIEVLFHGTAVMPPQTFRQPHWAVCRWESAMAILRGYCKEVIDFEESE